ncbi:MAG TPA: enoyl-ACP reductase [Bacteroidia bacterium]|nr:enoyl-ACP reductase [Bacteroidia bacterium]HNT80756.1 enoyl-ACP reductase [Bacteroidia bacterium]
MQVSNLLSGKRGIIFGALDSNSIAWKVAEKCHEQGAKFTLTNAPVALRMGAINQLAEQCGSTVIPADATNMTDLDNLLQKSQEILGGKLDFILHSIGMSLNVRKNKPYTDLDYDYFQKTLDISGLSFHRVLQSAYKSEVMNKNGSILALSYIAAQKVFPFYNDMADAKALLESIARSFGYHFGKRDGVRVNTVSQSPTRTTAGSGVKGFDTLYDYANIISPLGNATAESCADFCVVMFSDLSRMITMQNIYHDGGYSSTGVSVELIDIMNK